MKEKIIMSKKLNIIAAVVFLLCCGLFYVTRSYFDVNPFKEFSFVGTLVASYDEDGNKYIVDESGLRLMKLNSENILEWKKESSLGEFESLQKVVTSNGRIYLHDVQIDESIRLAGESIVEYDVNGKYLGTTAKYMYTETTLQSHIFGMTPVHDGIVYLYKVENEFRVISPGEGEKSYPLENAGIFLRSGSYDEKTDTVYYCTFDGKIFKYVDGVNDELLFAANEYDKKSIPNEICFNSGDLYVADIGLRDVLIIKTDTGKIERIAEEGDIPDKKIAYHLNADNGLITVARYYAKEYIGNNTYSYLTGCDLGIKHVLEAIVSKVAIIICGIALLYFVIVGAYLLLRSNSVYIKGIAGVIIATLLLSIIIISVLIPQFQTRLMDSFFSRAQIASDVMEELIPKDAFVRIREADDFMNDDYMAVKKVGTKVFLNGSDSMNDLYVCLYQIVDGVFGMTYSLTDSAGAFNPYDWDLKGSTEELVLTTKQGVRYQSNVDAGGEYLFIYDPIFDDEGNAIGIIEVGKDMQSYRSEIRHMISDAVINVFAVALVLILAIIEVIYFVKGRNEYIEKKTASATESYIELPPEIMRMVSFLMYFLANLTTAFLPIYAMKLAEEGGSLIAPEVMAAIPISAVVITGAISSILGVSLIEKLGEKKALFISSILFTLGFALRIIPNIWVLILGSAVFGIGWGVILLNGSLHITELPDEQKDLGFSQYNVAALNGVNCGVVFGGFLMNWVSYQMVFVISALLSLLILLITGKYFIREKVAASNINPKKRGMRILKTVAFLLTPQAWTIILLIIVPIMICSYFIYYMYPIIGSDYGLSDTYVGYSYLLNGLCVMAFGGAITNYFTKKNKKREGLVVASLIYALAFFIVIRFHNIPSLLLAIMLLGVSDGFGLPLQAGLYTDNPAVENYGLGNALGIYNLVINIAQAIGPFVFSYVLLVGVDNGLTLVLLTLSALALLFYIMGKLMDRKIHQRKLAKD